MSYEDTRAEAAIERLLVDLEEFQRFIGDSIEATRSMRENISTGTPVGHQFKMLMLLLGLRFTCADVLVSRAEMVRDDLRQTLKHLGENLPPLNG